MTLATDNAGDDAALHIAALISDVDGTLVTKAKLLTERARMAVAALRAGAIKFAIVSSRPPRGLQSLIAPLGLTTPLAGFNGGVIANPDLSIITQHLIPPDVARRAVTLMRARGADVWVFADGEWFLTNPAAPHIDTEERAVQFGPTLVEDFGERLDAAHKIVAVSTDHAMLAEAEVAVRDEIGDVATVVRSQLYYLDVTHKKANKGDAVLALAGLLRVPLRDVAVIGDGSNDVAMFEIARLSIAMGNAAPEVQARARFITDTNEADGFAKAVERHILETPEEPI
jgi:Cof subfamily protein (haloacid dehalogenase superfamily)